MAGTSTLVILHAADVFVVFNQLVEKIVGSRWPIRDVVINHHVVIQHQEPIGIRLLCCFDNRVARPELFRLCFDRETEIVLRHAPPAVICEAHPVFEDLRRHVSVTWHANNDSRQTHTGENSARNSALYGKSRLARRSISAEFSVMISAKRLLPQAHDPTLRISSMRTSALQSLQRRMKSV